MGNTPCTNKPSTNKEFQSHADIRNQYSQQFTAGSKHSKKERRCTISDIEIVSAKIRIQIDRIETRMENLKVQEAEIDKKIKDLINQKKKEEAYTNLKKKAEIKRRVKDAISKIAFLEQQIANIENAESDLAFSKAVGDSNRLIEKLTSEIDRDEILLAKQLQDDSKARREEIMEMLEDEDDDEIRRQVDEIEKQMSSAKNSSISGKKSEPVSISNIKKTDAVSELLMN